MNSSEDGRFSQETSVIMATIVEVVLRRLTDRPTVARTAAGDIRLVFRIPTRACDPRTEITRPNEVAEVE
ncbi:hypothetical protein [Nitrobacter sp. 62-13]|uniref:hypothetical protein n=1 Tax=Nitrobacter sp. 62-13 TaxID=1895797 RepID=UPI0025D51F71|nr:hypothetical protein [Nitrobacter sp. 62-13]